MALFAARYQQEGETMVFEPQESLKRKMAKNGSVLQYMHSVAGAGKGLIVMGVMLIGIGVMLAAALFNIMGADRAIVMASFIVVPSILLIVLGVFMQKKRESAWVPSYMKNTDMKEKDLHQIDQEFKQPGTILLSLDNGKDANSLKRMGFVTANYVKLPGVKPSIFRLEDIVACLYTKKMLCADGGYEDALIAYPLHGDWVYCWTSPPEKASLEIVKAIGERNPRIITDHHFTYEGKEYDAVSGMDAVKELCKQVYGKQ